jgi:hypothetical protein
MEITSVSLTALVPVFQLLGNILEYLTELQRNSKKHTQIIGELNATVTRLKKLMEGEIEARKKEEERSAANRAFTRKLVYGAAALACTPWIYIALHLAGWVR